MLQLTVFGFVLCIFPNLHLLQNCCNFFVVWKKFIEYIQRENTLSVYFVYNLKHGPPLALLDI
jgi:hypothetical protein